MRYRLEIYVYFTLIYVCHCMALDYKQFSGCLSECLYLKTFYAVNCELNKIKK